ncbi:MAG: DMT family transporter [Pseudomonadota bacterium]
MTDLAPRPALSPETTAILLMVVAMVLGPFMDLFAKLATEVVVPAQAGLGRFATQSLILLPVLALVREWCWPHRAHLLAGTCLAVAILTINTALEVMPIANALAIFFVEPLILTLLSALILKEQLGWRRLVAVALGLAGAMVVLRPNLTAYGWVAVLPLVTAFAFAGYMLVLRVMSPGGARIALQFWTGASASLVLTLALLAGTAHGVESLSLAWPTPEVWGLFLAAGALACICHQLIAQALARAEAGLLAPLQYLEIISAVGIGWVIFGDFPDRLTWIGTLMIVASGIYVFQRKRHLAEEVG